MCKSELLSSDKLADGEECFGVIMASNKRQYLAGSLADLASHEVLQANRTLLTHRLPQLRFCNSTQSISLWQSL